MSSPTEETLLEKLDKVAPASLNQFDAFPKLPTTYKSRSGSRGFLTLLVAFVSFLLVVNDISEWIWGWPTYDFTVDQNEKSFMNVNVDLVVNMPCGFLSVDLRDAVGDRLFLSQGFKRDGTIFDIGQAQSLQAHSLMLDARQAVAQSRKSRGLFDVLLRRQGNSFRPTYNYKPDGSACRVYGSINVKKVTANLHITTLGHGYASNQHVDHKAMNLSHVITDFSFGPYFPDMTQPLTNTLEITEDPFIAYQYFLTVVPTTYIASRSKPVQTNQYSVTHYTRVLEHDRGTPGIFFKFDMEPLNMKVEQRTTTFVQFLIRVVGVVGGVWCCAGWAFRISSKAIDIVSGADRAPGIVAAESSGASLKKKWGGGELRARVARQGGGWAVDGGSPYGSYAGTPLAGGFGLPSPSPYSPAPGQGPYSPAPPSAPHTNGHGNGNGNAGGYGLGLGSPSFATQQQRGLGVNGGALPPTPTVPSAQTVSLNSPSPYGAFPLSPNPASPSHPQSPGLFPTPPAFGPQSPHSPRSPPGPPRNKDGKKAD